MIGTNHLRNKLEQKKGQQKAKIEELNKEYEDLFIAQKEESYSIRSEEIIKMVALKTQRELEYIISETVSLALADIFDDPYKLEVFFEEKRGKTECDIFFERDEEYYKPIDASGGGAVDVAAFALRLCAWSLDKKRSRPIIILDEPFRFLSAGLQTRAGKMLKNISKKIGVQMLIITHNETLADYSDKTFYVSKIGNITKTEGKI